MYQQHLYNDVDTELNSGNETDTLAKPIPDASQITTLQNLYELQAGMTLVGDIFANNGGCLLKAGTLLDNRLVKRLRELSSIIDDHPIQVHLEESQAEEA